jgi:hypothetical protein
LLNTSCPASIRTPHLHGGIPTRSGPHSAFRTRNSPLTSIETYVYLTTEGPKPAPFAL